MDGTLPLALLLTYSSPPPCPLRISSSSLGAALTSMASSPNLSSSTAKAIFPYPTRQVSASPSIAKSLLDTRPIRPFCFQTEPLLGGIKIRAWDHHMKQARG